MFCRMTDTGYWILDVWELGIGGWDLTATATATVTCPSSLSWILDLGSENSKQIAQ